MSFETQIDPSKVSNFPTYSMVFDNNPSDFAERMQRCREYVEALESERRKIQVFERELPLCLELVTQGMSFMLFESFFFNLFFQDLWRVFVGFWFCELGFVGFQQILKKFKTLILISVLDEFTQCCICVCIISYIFFLIYS